MSEFERTLRKRKLSRRLESLQPRERQFVTEPVKACMPDTNIYINAAAGRLSVAGRSLVSGAILFHSSVALGEIMLGLAYADPRHPGTTASRKHYEDFAATIPDSRILAPDNAVWLDASLLAGTIARLQGYSVERRAACLNDALIYLTAAKAGLPVLTADWRDFDLLAQLAPEGRIVPC